VNRSIHAFGVEPLAEVTLGYDQAIRFGLEAIKGVGGAAVDAILEARTAAQFESVLDLCKRVPTRKMNKKVMESLILSGGMDSLLGEKLNRASLFASIENLMSYGQDEQAKAELGQSSLFDDFKAEEVRLSAPIDSLIKKEGEWPLARRLLSEKQVLGFFISGHPMQNWQSICADWLGHTTETLRAYAEKAPAATPQAQSWGQGGGGRPKRKEVKLAGIISEFKEITTKKGSKMAFFQLEDYIGRVEIIAFPEFYATNMAILQEMKDTPEPILITGEFDVKEGEPKILGTSVQKLEDAHGGRTLSVVIEVDPTRIQVDQLRLFKQLVLKSRGKSAVHLRFSAPGWKAKLDLPKELKVDGTPQFTAETNRIFGYPVAKLQ
jgi:DNA polymerase-3 subunit alpha